MCSPSLKGANAGNHPELTNPAFSDKQTHLMRPANDTRRKLPASDSHVFRSLMTFSKDYWTNSSISFNLKGLAMTIEQYKVNSSSTQIYL